MEYLDQPAVVRPPAFPAGNYFYFSSPAGSTTNGNSGTGTLRLLPWRLDRPMTLARLAAEITTVGDAGSKFRIGVYADNGSTYPGTLVIDAGQIAGDSATVQELTISTALTSGLYWVGGAVQAVTTTQPTIRSVSGWYPPVGPLPLGTTLPSAAGSLLGFSTGSVTGALPTTFPSGAFQSGAGPRIIGRSA